VAAAAGEDGGFEVRCADGVRLHARKLLLATGVGTSCPRSAASRRSTVEACTTGEPAARRALFFTTGQHQSSGLAARLGCRFTDQGAVNTGKCEATNVPGLYVCGDASRAQFVAVAVAELAAVAHAG
jgi:thioredoxin reductase